MSEHYGQEIGTWVAHLEDSTTLIPEQDNKTFKYMPTNGIAPAFFMGERVNTIKSLDLAGSTFAKANHYFPGQKRMSYDYWNSTSFLILRFRAKL